MTKSWPFGFTGRREAITLIASLMAAPAARSQTDYPNKPVHLVVGYPPGGSVDQVARLIADAMTRTLRGVFVVENLGGAAGAVGAQKVVTSAADGYTLLVGSNNELVTTGLLNNAQKYDAIKDLAPIGLIASGPVMWVAGPAAQVKDLDGCVQAIRRQPGKFSYGSSGVGSLLHFAGELLKQQSGLFITHIPYRGVAPLTSDLVGGRIEYAMMSLLAAIPHVQSGRLVALGVTTRGRVGSLPDVPALGEHPALKGYQLTGWFAMMAPQGLPAALQVQLRTALKNALTEPAVRKKLEENGLVVAAGTEDLAGMMAAERLKYEAVVRFAKITG